jgi:outer membrane usher protein
MLGYGYSSGGFSFSITDWRQDPGFGRQDDFPLVPVSGLAPKRRTSLDLSVALPAQQSVGLSLGRDKDQGGSQSDRLGIRYSTRLAGAISVFARVARSREDGRYANEAAVGVQFDLGRGWSGGVGLEQGPSGARQSLSVDRGRPDEGGWGGRALLENDSDWSRLEAVASRDFEAGAFTGLMSHRQGSGTSSGTALAAQFGGSLVYAGGDLRAARPVRDAFALVDTNGLAGVRVYRNNTLAGVTDSQGRLLLPGLGSYTRNQIRLDDRDIPIEVQLDAMTVDAVPRSRIGADVRFDTRRIISAGGRLRSRGPAGEASVAAAQILVTVDGTEVETSTGPDGDFYLDSLVPGEFVLQVRNASVACRAVMRVAKDAPAFTDLGELDCVSAP